MTDGFDEDSPYRIVVTLADLRGCGGESGATRFLHQVIRDCLVRNRLRVAADHCEPECGVGLLTAAGEGVDIAFTLTSLTPDEAGPRWLVYIQTRPGLDALGDGQRAVLAALHRDLTGDLLDLIIVREIAASRPGDDESPAAEPVVKPVLKH